MEQNRLFVPHCDEPPKPWSSTMEGKTDMFWAQGDFGYIKQEVDSMMDLCTPNTKLTEVNKFLVSHLVNSSL